MDFKKSNREVLEGPNFENQKFLIHRERDNFSVVGDEVCYRGSSLFKIEFELQKVARYVVESQIQPYLESFIDKEGFLHYDLCYRLIAVLTDPKVWSIGCC